MYSGLGVVTVGGLWRGRGACEGSDGVRQLVRYIQTRLILQRQPDRLCWGSYFFVRRL